MFCLPEQLTVRTEIDLVWCMRCKAILQAHRTAGVPVIARGADRQAIKMFRVRPSTSCNQS
eukprot:3239631-Pleurochrysis_carterae.AAC.3